MMTLGPGPGEKVSSPQSVIMTESLEIKPDKSQIMITFRPKLQKGNFWDGEDSLLALPRDPSLFLTWQYPKSQSLLSEMA